MGLLCGATLFFIQANDFQYISFEILKGLNNRFVIDLLVFGFYILHYLGIMAIMERTEFFNINQLLTNLAVLALLSYLIISIISMIPDLILGLEFGFQKVSQYKFIPVNPLLKFFIDKSESYILFLVVVVGLFSAKKLMFFTKSKQDISLWNIIQIIILSTLALVFIDLSHPVIYLGISCVILIPLLFFITRIKWVGVLSLKDKVKAISNLGLFLIGFFAILSNWLLPINIHSFPDLEYLLINHNAYFQYACIVFVFPYFIMSSLALLFSLPISDVFQQRKSQIAGFQELNILIKENINKDDLLELLFNLSVKNTNADAGLIIVNDPMTNYIFNRTDQLNEKYVSQILSCFKKDLVQKKFIYEPSLKKSKYSSDFPLNYGSVFSQNIELSNRRIGQIFLFKSYNNGFDEYMIRLTGTYINQAVIAMNNAELLDKAIESARLKEEMSIAKSIQEKLLPSDINDLKKPDVSAFYMPASEVGGDYYDVIKKSEDEVWFLIADVSGKGVNAAFHVAKMKGIFNALSQTEMDLEHFVIKANDAVCECFEKGVYITLILLKVDIKDKTLTWSRSGHCPIIYWDSNNNKANILNDKGLGLGILKSPKFKQHCHVNQRNYHEGDLIVLYTDGVVEARNDLKEEYGEDRLNACIHIDSVTTAQTLEKNIVTDLKQFIGTQNVFDDITSLIIKL
jgi:serine phosphatase RsbU (regulator of sigma subunit)